MKTILLLEPRAQRHEILHDCLERQFAVISANSVPEANKLLAEHRTDIGLVISGLHIEGNDSVFDVLRQAKKSGVPFMFCCLFPSHVTQTVRDSLLTAARLLGAEAVLLQESLDTNELMTTIETFRRRRAQ